MGVVKSVNSLNILAVILKGLVAQYADSKRAIYIGFLRVKKS